MRSTASTIRVSGMVKSGCFVLFVTAVVGLAEGVESVRVDFEVAAADVGGGGFAEVECGLEEDTAAPRSCGAGSFVGAGAGGCERERWPVTV